MTHRHVAAWVRVVGLAIFWGAASGCLHSPRNDSGARILGGHLRPTHTPGEMGLSAREALHGAAIGGDGGARIAGLMDRHAEDLANELRFARVWRIGEGIAIILESGLLFEAESSTLVTDIDGGLGGLARSLRDETRTRILILGHTDSFAANSYNQDMSKRRGEAVVTYLVSRGIAASRVHMRGLGAREPISPNDSIVGRYENRRIEIAIYAGDDWRKEMAHH